MLGTYNIVLRRNDNVITNPIWRMDAILKMFFLCISAANHPFWWNLVCGCKFWFRKYSRDAKSKISKSNMADRCHIENRYGFSAISQRRFVWL